MAYPIKFSSLPKAELEYEILVRNEVPANTVAALRKQIIPLSVSCPSEEILVSPLEILEDLNGICETLEKIKNILDSIHNTYSLLKAENLLAHLYHRLGRIDSDDLENSKDVYEGCMEQFHNSCGVLNKLKLSCKPPVPSSSSANEGSSTSSGQMNIVVHCDHNSVSELNKIKFDGKTCVRTFIQRLSEYCVMHKIDNSKLITLAFQLFVGDALLWYRSVCTGVTDWNIVLEYLKRDFDKPNFDYKLLEEIRNRTQGENELIVVYLTIMEGLFSRLSSPPDEKFKLEILLHNVRPCYASILASSDIASIDQLRCACRSYENVQGRLQSFHEPPRVTSDTLAPDLAYKVGRDDMSKRLSFNKFNNQPFNKFNNHSYSKFNSQFYNNNKKFNRFSSPPFKTNQFSQQQFNSPNKSLQQTNIHSVDNNIVNRGKYCQRCKSFSHSCVNCHKDRNVIFCFGCGKQNVKRPDCPQCKSKSDDNSNKNSKN